MTATNIPRCEWCRRSVDGDPAADRGPGTTVLCWTCRTLPDPDAVDMSSAEQAQVIGWEL